MHRYFIPGQGWHYGPTTSWVVEWYVHDETKCDCGGPDDYLESRCKGYSEPVKRVFSEEEARSFATRLLETEKKHLIHGPRWIKDTLEFSYHEPGIGDMYSWERDEFEEYVVDLCVTEGD